MPRPRRAWGAGSVRGILRRRAGFADECRRQSKAVAAADAGDHGLDEFLDTSLTDLLDGHDA